jgi:hypothetical protein
MATALDLGKQIKTSNLLSLKMSKFLAYHRLIVS